MKGDNKEEVSDVKIGKGKNLNYIVGHLRKPEYEKWEE